MRIALTAKSIAIYYTLAILIPDNKAFARPDKFILRTKCPQTLQFPNYPNRVNKEQ